MKHHIELTIEAWVDEGVYWPEAVRIAVSANASDPYKDLVSHLVAQVVLALQNVHGVELEGVSAHTHSTSTVD